jgi:2-polyprenyl-3-methyl-5-hydroxy-6-metoxy-1,4-benzoquinol methylase
MKMDKEFYSKYISTHTESLYGSLTIEDIRSQFKIWESFFGKIFNENKKAKILDIGCGSGGFVYWMQESGYKDSEGIDISDEQISLAKSLGIKNVHKADILSFLPDNKNKFDVIFARDILEHFKKEITPVLAKQVFDSLKEKGIFIAQTVNAENWLWGRLRHGDFTHEIAFTSSSIKQILKLAGFNKVNIYPQRPVIHGVKSFMRFVLWMIWEYFCRLLLVVETGTAKGSIFTQNIIVEAEK